MGENNFSARQIVTDQLAANRKGNAEFKKPVCIWGNFVDIEDEMESFVTEVKIVVAVETIIGKPETQIAVIFTGADFILCPETAVGQLVKSCRVTDEIRQFEFFAACFVYVDVVVEGISDDGRAGRAIGTFIVGD